MRLFMVIVGVSVAATLVHVFNAAGFPYGPSYAGFIAGVWAGFSVAVFQFLLLIGALLRYSARRPTGAADDVAQRVPFDLW